MSGPKRVIVALSGGVDSAVAALLLRDAGHDVQCLHMTNWMSDGGMSDGGMSDRGTTDGGLADAGEDDAYCNNARDFHDARSVCLKLGVPLHRVNFAREYREQVFAGFLEEHTRGRTPNPDVLCNREIKFGVLRRYARRLGGDALATGHYARLAAASDGTPQLLKARDGRKDQSYFLHAVAAEDFADVLFPLGELVKTDVRALAHAARLPVADKKDSTGICFIGERPFAEFLSRYLPDTPGVIRDADGRERGRHRGLAYYTLGQRSRLGLGGSATAAEAPWYVAAKNPARNELTVVQGHDHPLLYQDWLTASGAHWIGAAPAARGEGLRCTAKIRYRQPDQPCTVLRTGNDQFEVSFDQPQRVPTPGQYVVLYDGDRCLGGGVIERAERRAEQHAGDALRTAV